MRCRELRKIGAMLAMVEGDSFSAVQWGSGKSKYQWRLLEWVEEVYQISAQLHCSFYHILREANDIADFLAREGALL